MLVIVLPEFLDMPEVKVQLEHSLVSISKWEAIHEKPFFDKDPKSIDETLSYIEQMVLNDTIPESFLERLEPAHTESVNDYINHKQSATRFREETGGPKAPREVITSELIYYWCIQFNIPFTCETWHINRLMNLIQICGIKQTKPKKMSRQAQAAEMRRLNAERRSQLGSSG